MLDSQIKNIIDTFLKDDKDKIVSTRCHLHTHPELSGKEYDTAKYIEERLDSLGIEHKRVGETGVIGFIDTEKAGKTLILRADIDALPIKEKNDVPYASVNEGVMHACGHDAHTTCLLHAAEFLSKNKALYNGKIRLAFQQGEEIGLGARIFIDEGYLDGIDRCFGLHMAPYIPVGKIVLKSGSNNASVDWFRVTIHGKQSHISAPQAGVDALYIASNIIVSLQAILTKIIDPLDANLVGIGKMEAGTAYNIVASEAKFEGTIRSFSPDNRKLIKEKIESISKNIAESYGGTATFEWNDNTSALINDEKVTSEIVELVRDILGNDNVIIDMKPSLTGDDFAEFILKVPGTYAYVGSGNEKKPGTTNALHNDRFNIDEDTLLIGTKLLIAEAIDYLK